MLTDELDGSGWAWFIPLHDGTVSVGITMKQSMVGPKKKACGSTGTLDFYKKTLKETPGIAKFLENAYLSSEELKSASDWSYSASEYASRNLRITGDAGCFIDPLFSSGVHLAMNSGLSAATTICASLRGDCSEEDAIVWHSNKVAEGYTRFLLVVTSSLEQIYGKEENILNDLDEPGFNKAFEHFKPSAFCLLICSINAPKLMYRTVIQGTTEAGGKLTKEEIARSVDFCTKVIAKVENVKNPSSFDETKPGGARAAIAPAGESDVCNEAIRKILRTNRVMDLDTFKADVINGMAPNMERGHLGLVMATAAA